MGLERLTAVTVRTNSFTRFQTPMICCLCWSPSPDLTGKKEGPRVTGFHRAETPTEAGRAPDCTQEFSKHSLTLGPRQELGWTETTEERSSTCQWRGKGATPSPKEEEVPHPLRRLVQRRCFLYYSSRKSARQKPKHKYLGGGAGGAEEFPRAPLRQGRDRQWVEERGGWEEEESTPALHRPGRGPGCVWKPPWLHP